jgi:tetratricopeptide (TPR) repeat protein
MSVRHTIAAFLGVFLSVVCASFAYGVLLLVRGPSRALEAAEVRPAPLPPDVAALLERSDQRLKKGEVEQAILGYRRVLALGPHLEALLGLAEGEWRAGRQDVAVGECERVLRLDPLNKTALQRLAHAYAGRRETWDRSEALYRAYLAQVPGDAEAWLGLARVLSWRGRLDAAAEVYARADLQPLLTAEDRRNYALDLAAIGRGNEAEPILADLARSNPADVDVALTLGGLHSSRADWGAALPLYRVALEHRPDDPQANLTYGQALLALENYKAALGPLDRAARALPSHPEAILAYARALRGAGDLKRADAQFERVVALLGADSSVEREYGDLLMERSRYPQAVSYYRRALDHGLKDETLLAGIARALSASGKPGEALPYLEEAYALRPSGRLGLELARLYKRLGRNGRALEILGEIEHGPGSH